MGHSYTAPDDISMIKHAGKASSISSGFSPWNASPPELLDVPDYHCDPTPHNHASATLCILVINAISGFTLWGSFSIPTCEQACMGRGVEDDGKANPGRHRINNSIVL